jgi:hypothetical protein
LTLACASCGVSFVEEAWTSLCWEEGDSCVRYLDTKQVFSDYVATVDDPVGEADVDRWEATVEPIDGVFSFVGTTRLPDQEKRGYIDFLREHQALIEDLYGVVDAEIRAVAPGTLARNTADELGNIRIGVAPFLQQTNGSVGVANGDQVVFLLGVDRLAFNMVERGQSEVWVRSVVAHEMIHASHFASSEYGTSARSKRPMARSLWVEGLATWGSAHTGPTRYTLDDVFGADYAETCRASGAQWAADYLADWDSERAHAIWWKDNGEDPRGYGVITPGYCVAYLVVAAAAERRAFEDLLELEPEPAYALAREELASLAR